MPETVPGQWHVRRAAALLRAGAVVVHATEAVYGLAASAFDVEARARIAALKQRGASQQFLLICATLEQINDLAELETPCRADILASWPGPHTWILPARATAPRWLAAADGGIALRMTSHPQAAALCRHAGPLISTSANPHGKAPARTLYRARQYFGAAVDAYIAGYPGASARPSSIRDGRTGKFIRI